MEGSAAMSLQREKNYTIDDIYKLPDGERAEIIDGQIYFMAPPSRMHQKILMYISASISNYITQKGGPCEVYPVPFAVFLNKDESDYVEPDISVICDTTKLDDRGCSGAPDFIIEIVSPGNPEHDYITKLGKYKAAGVREYWIVDARNHTVTVYFFERDIFALHYNFTDAVKVNIYDDLYIDFSQFDI